MMKLVLMCKTDSGEVVLAREEGEMVVLPRHPKTRAGLCTSVLSNIWFLVLVCSFIFAFWSRPLRNFTI